MKIKKLNLGYFTGVLGAVLLFFIGWEHNVPLVTWIAFPILIFSFRNINKWKYTIPLLPLMIVIRFISIHKGWDLSLWMELGFSIIVLMPLIIALYIDRVYSKYLNSFLTTLIFPCVYIILDYFLTYANLGMTFSIAYSQSTCLEFVQIASILGSWFVEFIVLWFAPMAILFVTNINRLKDVWKPLTVYFAILSFIMLFGSFRLAFDRPVSKTVRIASITEEHKEDYWSITDNKTPRSEAEKHKEGMRQIQEKLFASSKSAADYGAKIIFWSEGNCPMYEDDYSSFLERAKLFAKENNVYFMPSAVVLLYGRDKNNNIAIMINPQGEVEYTYEKTISWYPSDSDGKIPVINTPYGKLATAICFDMDYPHFISQAKNADIMLVPAMDTKKIADYHTRAAFLRGIENGFTVVRQANKGASISADYMGNTLSYQNFFNTDSRIMITDAPTKGKWTFYGFIGEIFLCSVFAGFVLLNAWYFRKLLKTRN